jgi:gamma-glutamyl:cysteine ligase YbdK (ATP-grasp superfamily)
MDPAAELKLWPHENDVIYKTFDRIFSCQGHGWANLQSTHINLPFTGDREFGRLHAAIRLVLPIVSGLAASSPAVDGRMSGLMDTRLEIYRSNSKRVPAVAGIVIPERVFTRKDYEDGLLQSIYAALAQHDPDGVLRHEWVNSRGAIARFDRSAIEIRLVDVQECPLADIAIAAAISGAVRWLTEEVWCSTKSQQAWDERELAAMFRAGIEQADQVNIDQRDFLSSFGYPEKGRVRASELWQHLIETTVAGEAGYAEWQAPLATITSQGCLARRICRALGENPNRDDFAAVYERLADCLAEGIVFTP